MKNPFTWMLLVLVALIYSAVFSLHHPNPHLVAMSETSLTSAARMQKLVKTQARAWETGDVEAIVADFAEEAEFVVPGTAFQGKQAIRAAAKDYFANFTNTQVAIKRIIVNNHEGAVEWSWSDENRQTGKKNYADDAIVFALDNGKIVYWREYIDSQSPETNS